MRSVTVGVIDYGSGNLLSVKHSLEKIGFRVRISNSVIVLNQADILILPGVGAYPLAMEFLKATNLDNYLKRKAHENVPIIGICLGMQLLMEGSSEICKTNGLGLIPGDVFPLADNNWHIGWNRVDFTEINTEVFQKFKEDVYFNHSFSKNTVIQLLDSFIYFVENRVPGLHTSLMFY